MENLSLAEIQQEVTKELANKETLQALLNTTFKGLTENLMKQAIMDGMIRGFKFKDFREKNVYAIPYGQTYSLVTSIDHARKIGMRSGVVGKSEPEFEMSPDGKKLISCKVTIKKKVGDDIGEFVERVYLDEYSTGTNLWVSKPRTMLAKVAEMHALRMACPEELAQSYVEEELEKPERKVVVIDNTAHREKLVGAKNLDELKLVWAAMPIEAKTELASLKEELKTKFEAQAKPETQKPEEPAKATNEGN